jgi:hypothetical protein
MGIKDFRAKRLRASQIIGSGSKGNKFGGLGFGPHIVIYSASQAANFEGGVADELMTSSAGKDADVFISGAIGSRNAWIAMTAPRAGGTSIFGGDLHVSGNLSVGGSGGGGGVDVDWIDGGNKLKTTSSVSIDSDGKYVTALAVATVPTRPNMTDAFFFVSGARDNRGSATIRGTSVFGGDVVISGTLYAEKQIIEVDEEVSGALFVSGNLFVSRSAEVKQGLTVNVQKGSFSYNNFIVFGSGSGPGKKELITTRTNINQVLILSGGEKTSQHYNEANYEDVSLFVSGGTGSWPRRGAIRGTALFGGDTVVSGGLKVHGRGPAEGVPQGGTISGSIHFTHGGIAYLKQGANISIVSSSNGQITIDTRVTPGTMSSFTVSGDSGTQTIENGNDLKILGGTGTTSDVSATDTATININYAGVSNAILATGAGTPVGADPIWFSDADDSNIKKATISTLPFAASDTTYTLTATQDGSDVDILLDASAGSDSTLQLTAGSNVTLTRNAADNVTIAATATSAEWTDDGNILRPADGVGEAVGVGGTGSTLTDYDIVLLSDGTAVFNEQGLGSDFRVESKNKPHAIFVSGNLDQVLILSGGDADSYNSAAGSDISFHVSGGLGRRWQRRSGGGFSNRGVSVFAGDVVISGSLFVSGGRGKLVQTEGGSISGSIHRTAEGLSYLVAGTNVTIASASNGQVTITSTATSAEWTDEGDILRPADGVAESVGIGGTGTSISSYDIFLSSSGGAIFNQLNQPQDFRVASKNRSHAIFVSGNLDQVLILSGGDADAYNSAAGPDISFHVSGGLGTRWHRLNGGGGIGDRGVSVFDGDVVISGSLFVSGGRGKLVQTEGGSISGSIHRTAQGLSYIVAGSGVNVVSQSNGQITITSTATSAEWTDEGDILRPNEAAGDSVGIGATGNTSTAYPIFLNKDGGAIFNQLKGATGDFKVSSDNKTNMFIVDVSADRVGIGEIATPSTTLHIKDDTPTLRVQRSDNANNSTIEWAGSAGVKANAVHLAGDNDLIFSTWDTGQSALRESLRFDATKGRQVVILSGANVAASSMQPSQTTDIAFFVSGAIGARGKITSGSAVFGGDALISGSLLVSGSDPGGTISGSIHHTSEGLSYLVAGTNVTVVSGTNGQVTISSTASGGTMSSFTLAGDSGSPQTIENSNTLTVAGGTGLSSAASATDTVTVSIDYAGVDNAILAAGAATPVAGDTIWFSDGDDSTIKKATISSLPFGAGTMSSFTAAGDSGSSQAINDGNTLTIAGGTGLNSAASATDTITLNVDYTGTDNFIDSATDLEGNAIAANDTIVYHDASDDNVKKGLVSDLPFGAGTMSSFTLAGDSGTQTISDGDTLDVEGGSGIITAAAATDKVTVSIDYAGSNNFIEVHTPTATPVTGDKILFHDITDGDVKKTTIGDLPFGTGTMSNFTLAGDTGSSQTISDGNTLTIAGGVGIDSAASATDTVTLTLDVSELPALGTTAETSDYVVIEDVTDNSSKKVLISNLPTAASEWTDGGNFLRPSDLSGAEHVVIGGTSLGTADILLSADGGATFNAQGASVDFQVHSNTKSHAVLVDGSTDQVLILSGGDADSPDEAIATDVCFYVSGAQGSRNELGRLRGTSLFGGDVVMSGALYVHGSEQDAQGLNAAITLNSNQGSMIVWDSPGNTDPANADAFVYESGGFLYVSGTAGARIAASTGDAEMISFGDDCWMSASDDVYLVSNDDIICYVGDKMQVIQSYGTSGPGTFLSVFAQPTYNNFENVLDVGDGVGGGAAGVVINDDSSSTYDFRVESNLNQGMFVVDAGVNVAMFNSQEINVAGESPGLGQDVALFVSGTRDGINSTGGGVLMASGDLFVSGAIYEQDEVQLSLYTTDDADQITGTAEWSVFDEDAYSSVNYHTDIVTLQNCTFDQTKGVINVTSNNHRTRQHVLSFGIILQVNGSGSQNVLIKVRDGGTAGTILYAGSFLCIINTMNMFSHSIILPSGVAPCVTVQVGGGDVQVNQGSTLTYRNI